MKRAFGTAYADVVEHHVLLQSAALSYYFVLSVFPAMIILSALLGSIPLPHLFGYVTGSLSRLLPPDAMGPLRSVLLDVLTANHAAWLSLGMVGMIWAVSAAFDAMIEALNMAYDVKDLRPFWRIRLQALWLAAVTGGLVLAAIVVMIIGPRCGMWLAMRVHLPHALIMAGHVMRWLIALVLTLVAVEVLYFLAPNVKQRFRATLPGATLAVVCWVGFSYLLGFYFTHVAHFSRTYGTLAGFIAFMTWCYWNSFALLGGAELNAELAKVSRQGRLRPKDGSGADGSFGQAA